MGFRNPITTVPVSFNPSSPVSVQTAPGSALGTQTVQTLQASGTVLPSGAAVPVSPFARALVILATVTYPTASTPFTAEVSLVGAQSGFSPTPIMGEGMAIEEQSASGGIGTYALTAVVPIYPAIDDEYLLTINCAGPTLKNWWAIEDSGILGAAADAIVAGISPSGSPAQIQTDANGKLLLASGSTGAKTVLALGGAPPIESTPLIPAGLIKALNLAVNITTITAAGEIRIQDQSSGTPPLFSFTPSVVGDHYPPIALPNGGYFSAGGLLLFQEAGNMAGTITLTAIS